MEANTALRSKTLWDFTDLAEHNVESYNFLLRLSFPDQPRPVIFFNLSLGNLTGFYQSSNMQLYTMSYVHYYYYLNHNAITCKTARFPCVQRNEDRWEEILILSLHPQ